MSGQNLFYKTVEEILANIKEHHRKWEESFVDEYPDIVTSRRRRYSRLRIFIIKMGIKLTIIFLPFIFKIKPSIKYIFEGLRHRHLIEMLPESEVMVVGGRGEYLYCIKRGYSFLWIGYIAKAFQLFIWAGEEKTLSNSVNLIRKVFMENAEKKRYLFLWEDSQPAGMTLSAALQATPGLSIVCIEHGLLSTRDNTAALPEGINCQFNLVWDQSQLKIFKDDCNHEKEAFVLGLPYEVVKSPRHLRTVILVGHLGVQCDSVEYFYTLYHYCKIYRILQKHGFSVAFRPHPQDDISYIKKIFPVVNLEIKSELFSSGRMAFIGFSSSLLYEAGQFGNTIISLDTSNLAADTEFYADCFFAELDYDKLPQTLNELFDARSIKVDVNTEKLSLRFQRCLSQIDEFNENVTRLSKP